MEEKPNRISTGTMAAMLTVAGLVDALQILLDLFIVGVLVNRIIDILFAIGYMFWLALYGVNLFTRPMRFLSIFAAFIGEIIPIIDIAPLWTLDVWYIAQDVRSEDGQTSSLEKVVGLSPVTKPKKPGKIAPERSLPPPLPKPLPKQ